MTPPHGVPLDDSDPNLPAQPDPERKQEKELAQWFRCSNQEGGPVHELKKELAAMSEKVQASATALVELRTTFRTGAWWGSISLSAMAIAVAILAYLATARPTGHTTKGDGVPLVKTALAQGKATP